MSAATTDPTVLAALRAVYERDGRATVRSVAAEARVPFRTVYESLERLQALELAAWESQHSGTLRPAYPTPPVPGIVSVGAPVDVQALCRAWDAHCNQGLTP
jgi:hypothetical protein